MEGRRRPSIEPLGRDHDRAAFSCGVEALDLYLKRQAGQDQRRNIARVFVALGETSGPIVGYYTLSSFAIDVGELPPEIAKRLPRYKAIPAALIGRLAVSTDWQGRGLGALLLIDALKRVVDHGGSIGVFAVVVKAKDDSAVAFYEKHGFVRFRTRPDHLFLPLATARQLFEEKG